MLEHEEFAQEGTIIRDILRAKRAAMPELTNQDIANMAGLSVNTVNHCLSDRSKSSSAFTIGRLCKALHVSFDQCFGIEPDEKKDSPEKENALKLRRFRKSAMGLSRSWSARRIWRS